MEQVKINTAAPNIEMDVCEIRTTGDLFASTIQAKETFGWTLDKDKSDKKALSKKIKHHFMKKRKLVFTRPKVVAFGDKLNELEKECENLETKKKEYVKADPVSAFFLFVLLIIPGVIYLIVKSTQKKKIAKHNHEITLKQEQLITEAQNILDQQKITYKPLATSKIQYGKKNFQNPYIKASDGVADKAKSNTTSVSITQTTNLPFSGDKKE